MKKLAFALMTSALTAAAVLPASAASEYTGFYVGLNAGYGIGTGTSNGSFQPAVPGPVGTSQTDIGTKGLRGGLHFGYDHMMTKVFLLGLEASGDFSNTEGKANTFNGVNGTIETKAQRRDAFGLALRVGALLNNSMLTYLKVGAETAKWKLSSSTGDANFAVVGGGIPTATATKRLTGFVLGLGFETMLTKHISFGGEWTHTWYGKTKTVGPLRQTAALNNWTFDYKPRVNDFRLRIGYKF
jgi:opacity protein-like surface antigen